MLQWRFVCKQHHRCQLLSVYIAVYMTRCLTRCAPLTPQSTVGLSAAYEAALLASPGPLLPFDAAAPNPGAAALLPPDDNARHTSPSGLTGATHALNSTSCTTAYLLSGAAGLDSGCSSTHSNARRYSNSPDVSEVQEVRRQRTCWTFWPTWTRCPMKTCGLAVQVQGI